MRFPVSYFNVLLAFGFLVARPAYSQTDFNQKPIEYKTSPVSDTVHKLKLALESQGTQPTWDKRLGWLPAILEQLQIPTSSQTLVFSKTSLQRHRISPSRPRALYFNDDVYVGYVRHGKSLEIAAVDPHLGAVFYTVDQKNKDELTIKRDRGRCMSCHATRRTRDVPGFLTRSVFADSSGEMLTGLGDTVTDHTTPLEERFGGWYVTGSHGEIRHRGNAIADEEMDPPLDPMPGANRPSLEGLVDTAAYLEPHSDMVALMVLEHQTQFHNLVTRAAYQTRFGQYYDRALNRALERPEGTVSDSTERRISSAGDALIEYLLFVDEAPLASPILGSSSFAIEFAEQGPKTSDGRSLREFDLQESLFRYPCSYLIYSDAWDALPEPMLDYLRGRLREILDGNDVSGKFKHMSHEDRIAIREILQQTKPDRLAKATE